MPEPHPDLASAASAPAAAGGTGWTAPELADPHGHRHKQDKVRDMFGSIARRYDLNNHIHSLWLDSRWRRFAACQASVRPGDLVLDVACGTGDLTEAFARGGAASVIGVDFTQQMLDVAEHKRGRLPSALADLIGYRSGDAQNLPIADQSVDIVSIAFGLRNIADPARAVREFRRVLRPGGRLVILEFAQPRRRLVRWFNTLYCRRIMPVTATLLSGDRSGAYYYLPASVGTFMSVEQVCQMLREGGFGQVQAMPLAMGICVCYRAVVAGPAA
jgi:demethylmenaquinone methyltransferase/2-methoxy-6-polyprenyl-1,4-benzoquinol methylase